VVVERTRRQRRNAVPKLANGDHVQGLMDNQGGSGGRPSGGHDEPADSDRPGLPVSRSRGRSSARIDHSQTVSSAMRTFGGRK
jgi:hypothetical protein